MGEQLYRLSALPDKRTALDVVHPQVHNYPGSALIDDPDVHHLSVLAGWRRRSARDARPAMAAGVVWPRTSCKPWQRILPERGRDFGLNAWILRLETRLANAVQSACPDRS